MSDEPLTRAELEEVRRHHKGKPPTRALPNDFFRDPIYTARLSREIIERERMKMWKKEQ